MTRFITFLALLLAATAGLSQPLDVTDAWIKNLPPSMPIRAGYMQLMNPDSKSATIVSISSDAFKKIEIHQTMNNDGMMSMQPVDKLVLKPNAMITLKPGGMHLMMMKPTKALKPGDEIKLTLQFDGGTSQSILMTVKK
ncbi:MAG: copper(I)-binding protein [Gammaproteobacteria bacterium]|jgi:copper(I)-binding protein